MSERVSTVPTMVATPSSFYLGSGKGRASLTSWDEVEIAAAAGVLEESAWVELKQAVPASSKPANQELARDLASLSVDGGTLIIGITDKTHDVVGTDEPAAAITPASSRSPAPSLAHRCSSTSECSPARQATSTSSSSPFPPQAAHPTWSPATTSAAAPKGNAS